MTVPRLNAIGFCAHYSPAGDWAFDYALRLSRLHSLRLNVFHFLTDPYSDDDQGAKMLSREERAGEVIARERELRMYYDERAWDYLDVGFRLCEDNEWRELHRCLLIREFQVLVLGYIEPFVSFAGRPIEEFADQFVSPVVLVGPGGAFEYRLNSRAAMMADRLGIPREDWRVIQGANA